MTTATIINKEDIVRDLKNVYLFSDFESKELLAIINRSTIIHFDQNKTVIEEGEVGEAMYVILSGILNVYTRDSNGSEVHLKELTSGDFFGEQALLHQNLNRRNASVASVTAVELLEIPNAVFQQFISEKSNIQDDLKRLGTEQLYQRLAQTSALFRSIKLGDDISNWVTKGNYHKGDLIYKENEIGENFYLIIEGTVELFANKNGAHHTQRFVGPGGYFGEVALIKKVPQEFSARARSNLQTLELKGSKFSALYKQSPELRVHFDQIRAVYNLPRGGFLSMHSSKFLDMPAMSTVYHCESGIELVVTKVVGKSIISIGKTNTDILKDTSNVVYSDFSRAVFRKLEVHNGIIVSAVCHGSWPDLGYLLEQCLDGRKLKKRQLSLFRLRGELRIDRDGHDDGADEFICKCAQIDRRQIKRQIDRGFRSVGDIREETGASSVCGACTPLVAEMIGNSEFVGAKIVGSQLVAEDIMSFTIQPRQGFVSHHRAGQHIDIETEIESETVRRSYTLTSPIEDGNRLEITVKREPEGVFSNWLHSDATSFHPIRISKPKGGFYTRDTDIHTLIFFAGGIGVTPAISYIRSHTGVFKRKVLLIISAKSESKVAHLPELREIEKENELLTIKLLTSDRDRSLREQDIDQIIAMNMNGQFLVCGPASYEKYVMGALARQEVSQDKIQIESFSHKTSPLAVASQKRTEKIGILVAQSVFLICIAIFFVPSMSTITSFQSPGFVERLINDKILHQVTGYILVASVFVGLGLSLRKRVKKLTIGSFGNWRLVHLLFSAIAVGLLVSHTGLTLGANINQGLMLLFLSIGVLGSSVMTLRYIGVALPVNKRTKIQDHINWLHIALSTLLPSFIIVHIVTGYYF